MKSFCERIVVMTSDVSYAITDSFADFATGVFNFRITGFIRHKKALETGQCSVV